MNESTAHAELAEAATAFLEWRDQVRDANGLSVVIGRAHGQKLLGSYIHALSKFAAERGADAAALEPARRFAIALNDGGAGFGNPIFRHEDDLHDMAWTRWGGRKAPSRLWMEGRASGCARFMVDMGLPVGRACGIVAGVFGLMGHTGRKGGKLSARIVRDWYDSLTTRSIRADNINRDGWAVATGVADLERQNEALETVSRLLKRAAHEPDWGEWITDEMRDLAHSCSIDPPSIFRLGQDLTGR